MVSPHFTMNMQGEAYIRAVSLVSFFSEKEMNEHQPMPVVLWVRSNLRGYADLLVIVIY